MLKYLSLFSGIGAFEKALERLNVPFDLVGYSETDKFASKAYSLLHKVPESINLGDITQMDEKALPDDIDLITYGFPCQDISLAGYQKGLLNVDGTKTRSGLFFDALRVIEYTQAKIAVAENVKNLTGAMFKEQFNVILHELEEAGYNNYWRIMNAKDFEIPQHRERVFIVSIRKDIDTGVFEFPEPVPLVKQLKDLLEDTVFEVTAPKIEPVNPEKDGTCRTIKAQYHKTSMANFQRTGTFGTTGVTNGISIRKLTPKECFRLMGFDDSDVDLLNTSRISDTQLYKMAGNSIVVNVLEFLFCQIFDSDNEIWV